MSRRGQPIRSKSLEAVSCIRGWKEGEDVELTEIQELILSATPTPRLAYGNSRAMQACRYTRFRAGAAVRASLRPIPSRCWEGLSQIGPRHLLALRGSFCTRRLATSGVPAAAEWKHT